MASVSRTAQFAHVFKVLKKHYKPVPPDLQRPVLEHLLYACCLENARYETADEVFAALVEMFYDWNEVRVTSIAELAESMASLPDPRAAANRLKRVLQAVFEATYAFDLEEKRKKNLGPTIKWLQKMDGISNFCIGYVVQTALGGHAIPVDSGVLGALRVVDLVADKDVQRSVVPGLERAVAKSKGVEFASLLHQFGADFTANPYSPAIRRILLDINPDCKDQLPKRRSRKSARELESAEADQPTDHKPAKGARKKAARSRGKEAEKEKKGPGRKKSASQREDSPSAPKGKSGSTKRKAVSPEEKAAVTNNSAEAESKKRKSASEGLSKRKPR